MNKIALAKLRTLIRERLYATACVRASVSGGWFVRRPAQ